MAIKPVVNQEKVNVKVNGSFQKICPFPVGFIYQSFESTSPGEIFGGNWLEITGRFLYCDKNTSTGGSNKEYIKLNQIPQHKHAIFGGYSATDSGGVDAITYGKHISTSTKDTTSFCKAIPLSPTAETTTPLEIVPFSKMPAYQSCYAWRRVS